MVRSEKNTQPFDRAHVGLDLQGGRHGRSNGPRRRSDFGRCAELRMSLVAQRVLEVTGKSNLREVWPNLWLYMHGGVGFEPYRNTFDNLIPNVPGCPPMHYLETYNASEGFFAYQDDLSRDDMALLMDHGIYYEFVPLSELGLKSLVPWSSGKWRKGKRTRS